MTVDISAYFESLSQEFRAIQNRVRYLIGLSHSPTDGEWKESILRSVLRRHLPASVEVGRGFVIGSDGNTRQLDVLVYDSSRPVLFRDGDLVIVTTDAVRAIVEVKTKLNTSRFREAIGKLADNAEFLHTNATEDSVIANPPFIGLFSYEWEGRSESLHNVLSNLLETANAGRERHIAPLHRVVNHVTLGDSYFARFWRRDPSSQRGVSYNTWHAYNLENKAFGYFIHNLLDAISDQSVNNNQDVWFPRSGKEIANSKLVCVL
jgi:hypothetical protein